MQSSAAGLSGRALKVTPLAAILAERIRGRGPITFAEYMEACLYDPRYGYYSNPAYQPRRDYFTSVDAGSLFGRLVARQLVEMWNLLGRPEPFWVIEAGAGNGALARQILDFVAESFPDFYAASKYFAVERCAARRATHPEILKEHAQWSPFVSAAELPEAIPVGCVFSNELLDALVVHRVVQESEGMKELYVGTDGERLHEVVGSLSSPRIFDYFADQRIVLHDAQQAEAGLAACDWIEDVGRRLQRGFVLTIDYGREARELYDERHMRGTLLAYEHHRASEEFYRAPGEQDLTAHVNFTALALWGRGSGLVHTSLTTQSNFLLALARKSNFADVEIERASDREKLRRRLLFKTLVYPEGMGETFQVFVQHKGIDSPQLTGLEPL